MNTQQNIVSGLRGVRYQVKDVSRSVAFYTEQLGFELDMESLPVFAQVSTAGLELILSGPGASGSRPMADGHEQEPGGWNRIVLQVADLPARVDALTKAGLHFRNRMEVGPGGKQIQLEDPDGNPIELFEPARESKMSGTEFDTFFATRRQAAGAYVIGDGGPVDALVPHEGDASFFSPRGDVVIGAGKVAQRYAHDAKAFNADGTTQLEVLQKGESGELAFWTGYQLAHVRIGAMTEPQDMKIRVTEIFRKIHGVWKLVHRHADIPQAPR
jgi:glyoxylase I family protein